MWHKRAWARTHKTRLMLHLPAPSILAHTVQMSTASHELQYLIFINLSVLLLRFSIITAILPAPAANIKISSYIDVVHPTADSVSCVSVDGASRHPFHRQQIMHYRPATAHEQTSDCQEWLPPWHMTGVGGWVGPVSVAADFDKHILLLTILKSVSSHGVWRIRPDRKCPSNEFEFHAFECMNTID